jgi:hypothetical protein
MTGFGSVLFLGQKPVQTGLARFFQGLALFFFIWLGFFGFAPFFSVSVWFFWFFAYKIKTEPNWPVFLNF